MKDPKGHGSNKRGTSLHKPLPDHAYHGKSDAELHYIVKDASEAAKASQSMGKPENKYNDQVNDAATVLGYRKRLSDSEAAGSLKSGSGSKSDPVTLHSGMNVGGGYNAGNGRHDYNPGSVNEAIASSNRAGRRIGGKEASMIHRLMRGRG